MTAAIHPAALDAAILMRRVRHAAPPPLPAAFARLDPVDLELKTIQAALHVLGVRQVELARRLGVSDGWLSARLTGAKPTTEVQRYLFAVAIFVEDRAEVARIQRRLADRDTLDGVDLATLAVVGRAAGGEEAAR